MQRGLQRDRSSLPANAVDKHATTILMPVGARRALNDLPDEVWTKINIEFYSNPEDGVFKALIE